MRGSAVFLIRASRWDSLGVTASLLCITHCLALPVIAVVLPTLALAEIATHRVLVLLVFLMGILAFVSGYKRHRKRGVWIGCVLGVGMLLTAVLLPEQLVSEALETVLTVAGGAVMVVSHVANARFCRVCLNCGEGGCGAV